MVAPKVCGCGKANVLLHAFKDKQLCKECYKKAKKTAIDENVAKEKAAHEEALAKKTKAAADAAPAQTA